MTASDLKEWVAIFMMDLVPDGQGGSIERIPAGLVADTPAAVRQPSGGRVWTADQLSDRNRFEVTIRFQDWVTTAYRVMWRDQFFDIANVTNIEDVADTWLQLTCERRELGTQ